MPRRATTNNYNNRLSVNTLAVLLNNAGAGIEAAVNKAAPANDASFAFKTNWSARALIGLLGGEDFSFRVSPDGSAFYEVIRIDRTSGRVEMPAWCFRRSMPCPRRRPPASWRSMRETAQGPDGARRSAPSGRFFPLQPHFGVNRIATWAPSTGTTVNITGMLRTAFGTVSTPTLATTNLSTSMRRWRVTSAATADAAAEERSAGWGLLARQCGWAGRLHLCEPTFAGHPTGDWYGVLRPLRFDDSAGQLSSLIHNTCHCLLPREVQFNIVFHGGILPAD